VSIKKKNEQWESVASSLSFFCCCQVKAICSNPGRQNESISSVLITPSLTLFNTLVPREIVKVSGLSSAGWMSSHFTTNNWWSRVTTKDSLNEYTLASSYNYQSRETTWYHRSQLGYRVIKVSTNLSSTRNNAAGHTTIYFSRIKPTFWIFLFFHMNWFTPCCEE